MNIFLGDEITLVKDETFVTGRTRGVILDATGHVERVYINGMDTCFWLKDGWKFADEETDWEEEEEDEI